MLMNPHRRRVDHLDVAVEGFRDSGHHPVPDAGLAPANEAVVAGRVRAILSRKSTPRRSRPQNPEDAVQDTPVVYAGHAARLVRQQRLDHIPLEIRQFVSVHHKLPSFGSLNHS